MFDLLDGVRVLDLGRGHAGPYCGKLFSDSGADVIHVERPGRGDSSRTAGPFAPEDTRQEFSASHAFLNAGKRSITLDYATPGGAELLRELVKKADILIENGRPGSLARYGFGADDLLAINPALVVISISNYGQTGPYRDRPASEMTLQAASGLMDGNGELGRPPLRYPMNLAQHWAGSNAAYTGLVAYWNALMAGVGQQVDVSIQESLSTSWYMVWADYQYTGSLQARGQSDLLPASDGRLMIRWHTTVPWDTYAIAMGATELVTEPGLQPPGGMSVTADKLADALAPHTIEKPRREWMDVAMGIGLPAGMLQSLDEIAECENLEARNFWGETQTPSGHDVRFPGTFYVVDSEEREVPRRKVPALGQHNDEVYGGLLSKSPSELGQLRSAGAI